MKALTAEQQARWVQQWKKAASALSEQRSAELRAITKSEAWEAIEALLSLPLTTPLSPVRENYSGLVDLERYLLRLRRR